MVAATHGPASAMSLIRHLTFGLIYGAVAVAMALTLPYSVPALDQWTAVVIGAVALLFGVVVHETYARQQRERALRGEVGELTRSRDAVQGELARAREELRAIGSKVSQYPATGRTLDEVAAEVAMLQKLVAELSAAQRHPLADMLVPPSTVGALAETPPSATAPAGPAEADEDVLGAVREAVNADRIEFAIQPIVSLPQRKERHFEGFSRLRTADGAVLTPRRYRSVAERAGLTRSIDNLLLFRLIQLVRENLRKHRASCYFARISVHSLRDEAFMDDLVEFMSHNPELAPRLVFEFVMDELWDSMGAIRSPLLRLAALGFRFCIVKVHRLARLKVDVLERCDIRFVKVEAATLLAELTDPAQSLDWPRFKHDLDEAGVDLIVNGIDDEATLLELLEHPVDFGQGALFGKPARIGAGRGSAQRRPRSISTPTSASG